MSTSSETLLAAPSERMVSLDVFRGMTIAGMILVNHPGSWGQIYKPLGHASWNGWTPTDLVFPFFLFIMGVAMTLSFDRRVAAGQGRAGLLGHVIRRALILIFLGLTMYALPDVRLAAPYVLGIVGLTLLFRHEPPLGLGRSAGERAVKAGAWLTIGAAVVWWCWDYAYFEQRGLRVPGVLQRIGLVYLAAGAIVLWTRTRGRVAWAVGLLVGYWALVRLVPAPGDMGLPVERQAHAINEWLDQALLGRHLYRERPDPEGLLSTLPAIATALLGVLTGQWLQTARPQTEKLAGLFIAGNVLLAAGLILDPLFPINKKIWSSPYVLFTAGFGLHVLGMCYWLIDILKVRRWASPFVVLGTNAILVFFAAHVTSKMLGRWRWSLPDGTTMSAYSWLYKTLFASWAGPLNGSLLFAISYVLVWLAILTPLYRKKIFVKI
ncbi:MAG: lpg1661 family Dot/Icm T4SS effector [Candidatus Sumerlaeia bacterium]